MKRQITKLFALAAAFLGLQLFTATPAMAEGENPAIWYKFDGNYNASGSSTLSFNGEKASNFSSAVDGQALKIVDNSTHPYGSGWSYGSGQWAVTVLARPIKNDSNKIVIWTSGVKSGWFGLVSDSANNKMILAAGNGNGISTTICEVSVPNVTAAFHLYTVRFVGSNTYELIVDGNTSGKATATYSTAIPSDNYQIGAVQGGMPTGLARTTGTLIDDLRIYQRTFTDAEVQALATQFLPEKSIVSFNFGADTFDRLVSGDPGAVFDDNNWYNTSTASGSVVAGNVTVTYSSKNLYNKDSQGKAFNKGYLDDGNGVTITATGLENGKYDLVIYCATDNESKIWTYKTVNGTNYYWDSTAGAAAVGTDNWGANTFDASAAEPGTHALKITELNVTDGQIAISAASTSGQTTYRSCISAIQIKKHSATAVDFTGTISAATATWSDKTGITSSDTWLNDPQSTITLANNDQAASTLTFDEAVTAAKFTLTSAAGKNTTVAKADGTTLAIAAYDFSGANGKTTVGYGTESASVSAGSDTVLTASGAGALTVAANKKATLMNSWSGSPSVAANGELVYAGSQTLTSVPLSGDAKYANVVGAVSYACPIAVSDNGGAQFAYALTRNFKNGLNLTAKRFVNGNRNDSTKQYFTQDAGTSIIVNGAGSDTDTAAAPVLFAHWPSTVTYTMNGGVFDARQTRTSSGGSEGARVMFGRDGAITMTIGTGTDDAWFYAPGIYHGDRQDKGTCTLTVGGKGHLVLGARGLDFTKKNDKVFKLNGGVLANYEANTIQTTANIALEADSVVSNDYAMTISSVLAGNFGITKKGSGTLTLSGANAYTGATTVSAGQLDLPANSLSGAVTLADGTTLNVTGESGLASYTITSGTFTPSTGTILLNGQTLEDAGYELKDNQIVTKHVPTTLYAPSGDLTITDDTPFATTKGGEATTKLGAGDTLIFCNTQTVVFNQAAVLADIQVIDGAVLTVNNGTSGYALNDTQVTITAGTLKLNNNNGAEDAKVNTTTFNIGANGELTNNGWLTFDGVVTINSDSDKTILNNSGQTISRIRGTGTIVKGGSGKITLASIPQEGSSAHPITINAGTLSLHTGNQSYALGAVTGSGTLDLPDAGTAITPASMADTITLTGAGTWVCGSTLPTGTPKTSLTTANWTGTLWIKNKTNWNAWDLESYGNANSKIKLTGVTGYAPDSSKTCNSEIILEDEGTTKALTIANGWSSTTYAYTIAKLSGSGTWTRSHDAAQNYNILDISGFTGTFALGDAGPVINIGTGTHSVSRGNGSIIYIDSGYAATIASGKTWSAKNGIVVNGTLNNNGTLTGTVTGSGTIVYSGVSSAPTAPTGLTANAWTGTVWFKNATVGGWEFGNYCNDASKVKFTGVKGWLKNAGTDNVCPQGIAELVLENDGDTLAFELTASSENRAYTFTKFTGSGTFKCATSAESACAVAVADVSDFTGKLISAAGTSANPRPIYIADTVTSAIAGTAALINVGAGETIRSGFGWEAAAVEFGATLTVKGAVNDVIVSGITTAPTLNTAVTLLDPSTGETIAGNYTLSYADGAVKVAEVTATHLGWNGTAWTNDVGTVVTDITSSYILDAKAGDNISFSTAAAPYAFHMPQTGTVTVNNQNNLTVTAIDIPAEATLVLGSNATPGFGVTGTGTLKYGTASADANIVTATQLANFTGTFWMTSGRHKYSEAIASAVTVKVTDGAVLWLDGGSWANRFEISGQGWKTNMNNDRIEYCALRLEGDYIADGATINFTAVGDQLPAIGRVGNTITLGCTLTGNGFAKFGSANLVMRNLANYSTLTGTVAIDFGNLTIGNNAAGTAKIGDVLQMNAGSTLTLDMATTDNYPNTIASELKPNGCTITLDDGSYKFSRINVTGTGSTISPIYDKLQKIEYLTGDGELTLSWRNTGYHSKPYTVVDGDFTGTLVLNGANTGNGCATLTPTGLALANATVTANQNSSITMAGDATIGTLNCAMPISGTGTLTLKGGTVSGVIGGSLNLAVAGDVTLSGANTYSGTTTVSSGSLVLTGSGTIGTGNYSVASGATLNLGQTRPAGKLLASSQGMVIIKLQNTAEEEEAFNTGAQVKLIDVEGSPFAGQVTIVDATGAVRTVKSVAVVDGKLAVTKADEDKVPPFRTSAPNGNWTAAGWTDSSSTHVAITGDDWTNQVSAVIDANSATSTLTTDRTIHLGDFMVTNANALTISASGDNTLTVEEFVLSNTGTLTLSGDAITATTIDDRMSTGTTTIGFNPGAAAITAGANTILTTLGTGNLTIAAEKKLTVKSDGLVATKVSNSGTLNFQGGSEADPIDIAGDGNFGTVTLEADTYVKNTVTDNRAHVVTGQGASSWYILNRTDAGVGFISPAASALTNLTLVSDCGNSQRVWIERVILKDVRLLAKTTFHLNGMSPTVLALAGSGDVTRAGTTETLTINPDEDSTYAGASSVPFIIGGTKVQTLSGAYAGALTINEGGTCALEGDTVAPSSITDNGTLRIGTRCNFTISGSGTVEVTLTAAEYAPGVSTKLFTAGDTTPSIVLKDSAGATIPTDYYTVSGTTVTFKKEATDGTLYYFTLKQAIETQAAGTAIEMVADVTDTQTINVTKAISFDGGTNILSNVTFTFDGGTLTLNTGCIGIGYTAGMTLAGGCCRFTADSKTTWDVQDVRPEGYEMATLSAAVREGYLYEFVKSAFVPDPATEQLIPVADQNGNDVGAIKLKTAFVNSVTTATTAQGQAVELNTKQSNNLMKWENAVLGLDGTKEASKPVVTFAQSSSSTDKIAFTLGGCKIDPATSGATATFKVYSASEPDAQSWTEETTTPVDYNASAEITLPPSGVKYYKYEVTPTTSK